MKKSARYIYPRPLTKRRHSWRWLVIAASVVVAASFFAFYDDGLKLVALSPESTTALVAEKGAEGESSGSASHADGGDVMEALGVATLPAAPTSLTPSEVAARAAAMEEEPERPGMLLATLGDGFNRLKSLPFFLPSPEEAQEEAVLSSSDSADSESVASSAEETLDQKDTEPVVYTKNERYTVETDAVGRQTFFSTVAKGDTAGVILNQWLSAADCSNAINAANAVYSLTKIHEGRPFRVERSTTGDFERFLYEADNRQCLVLERKGDAFVARMEAIAYEMQLVRVEGTINSSLFEAVGDAGEGPVLAVNLAEVFSCEVNFINELRQGDHFEVLIEKLYRDGEFKSYGNMMAARFTNQGRTYDAYLFRDETGRLRHYNGKGEALQKTLLKAPLSFTRVSSGYSMNRKHPVFGYSRPHQGVDYAAPTGTPIKAVGDGTVTKAGWGNGYGNMIILKHGGGLESQYAHMSALAKGIKSGMRVKQGQTIGYVGATGVATGPHLDFRLKQNGNFINPTKVIVPRSEPVGKKQMVTFQHSVAMAKAYMDGQTALAEYAPPEWSK